MTGEEMFDLLTAAAERVTPRREDILAGIGVRLRAQATALGQGGAPVTVEGRVLCGVAPIAVSTEPRAPETGLAGWWESADAGPGAIIVPVGISHDGLYWDYIDDLVACYPPIPGQRQPAGPDRWWLRVGAGEMLGADYVAACVDAGTPARLVSTPLEWLRAGGAAACILDWRRADPRRLFGGLDRVECDTDALAKRLRRRVAELARPAWVIATAADGAVPVAQRAAARPGSAAPRAPGARPAPPPPITPPPGARRQRQERANA